MSDLRMFLCAVSIYSEKMEKAYCVKCRNKVEMSNPKQITTKNGRKARSGQCSVCGTKMMTFI